MTSVETSRTKLINLEPATHLTNDIFSIRMLWVILYWLYFVIYESGFCDTFKWASNNVSMSIKGYLMSMNDIAALNKSFGTTVFKYKIIWKDIMWWYLMPFIYYLILVCTLTPFCKCMGDLTVKYLVSSIPITPQSSMTNSVGLNSFDMDFNTCKTLLWIMNLDREEYDCSLDLSQVTTGPSRSSTVTPSFTIGYLTNLSSSPTRSMTINYEVKSIHERELNINDRARDRAYINWPNLTYYGTTINSISNYSSSSSLSEGSGSNTDVGKIKNPIEINHLRNYNPSLVSLGTFLETTGANLKCTGCASWTHPDLRDPGIKLIPYRKDCMHWTDMGVSLFKSDCCSVPSTLQDIDLIKYNDYDEFHNVELKHKTNYELPQHGQVIHLWNQIKGISFGNMQVWYIEFDKIIDGYNVEYFETYNISSKLSLSHNQDPILSYSYINVFNLKNKYNNHIITCIVPHEYYYTGIKIIIRCMDRDNFKFVTQNLIDKKYEVFKINQNYTQKRFALVFACIPLVLDTVRINMTKNALALSAFHFPYIYNIKYEILYSEEDNDKKLTLLDFWTILPQNDSVHTCQINTPTEEIDTLHHSFYPFNNQYKLDSYILTTSGEVIIKYKDIKINEDYISSFECIIENYISNMIIQCYESTVVPKYAIAYEIDNKNQNLKNRIGLYLTDSYYLNENGEKRHYVKFVDKVDEKVIEIKLYDSKITEK